MPCDLTTTSLVEHAASSSAFNPLNVIPTLLEAIEDKLDVATKVKARIRMKLQTISQLAQEHRVNCVDQLDTTGDTKLQHMRKARNLRDQSADLDILQVKISDAIEFMLRRKADWETWIEIGRTARVVGGRVFLEKTEDARTLYQIKKRQQQEFQQVEETYALIGGLPVEFQVYTDCRMSKPGSGIADVLSGRA